MSKLYILVAGMITGFVSGVIAAILGLITAVLWMDQDEDDSFDEAERIPNEVLVIRLRAHKHTQLLDREAVMQMVEGLESQGNSSEQAGEVWSWKWALDKVREGLGKVETVKVHG